MRSRRITLMAEPRSEDAGCPGECARVAAALRALPAVRAELPRALRSVERVNLDIAWSWVQARAGRQRHVSLADAGLGFARGVPRPFCLCWRPDIGTERRIRIGEEPHWPRPHGSVGVGAGQERAIWTERHAGHAPPRTDTGREGSADGLPGGWVPQLHSAVRLGAGQQLAVRSSGRRSELVILCPPGQREEVVLWVVIPRGWRVCGASGNGGRGRAARRWRRRARRAGCRRAGRRRVVRRSRGPRAR